MKKKLILSLIVISIFIGGVLSLGKVKSEQDIAREMEKIARKEKEDMINFKLSDINKKNYLILKTTHVDEYKMDIVELSHKVTKCKIVLMLCDDENKAFNISFKTFPSSNNGICHIAEHSTLCGSRKYDIKDPFFLMVKTSLATFMNAMTSNDMTYYPISSANDKDFKNLMDIYLDAVFFPNMLKDPNILKQEGWHYEIDSENDDLKVNGVVFNEMQGTMGDPHDALHYYIFDDLYNGTAYKYNFGGEAKDIINLTFDEFKAFHDMYYSPSNAYIYLYGLLDMNERLEYLQNEYLSKFDYVDVKLPVFDINKIESKDSVRYYDSDTKDKDKSIIAYNFLIKDDKDNLKNIVTNILANILFYKEGALLKDKLVKDGFGEEISFEYDSSLANSFTSIVVENINASKKDEFVKAVDDTVKDILENGIDKDILVSSINTAYLNACEANPGSMTRGLSLIFNSLETYSNGRGVDNFIKYKAAFDRLFKEDLTNKNNIFMQRLKEMFVDCEKKCVTVVSPKSGYIAGQKAELADILKKRKEELLKKDPDSIKNIVKEYAEYKVDRAKEDTKEALDKMPKLSVSDIQREVQLITSEEKEIYGKKVLSTAENTGELIYIGVDYKLPKVNEDFPDSEKFLLTIATALLGSLDTKNYTYEELDTLINMYTGGISISTVLNDVQPYIQVSTKTKKENIDKVYEIINEILYNTKFTDKDRIKQKLSEFKIISNEAVSSYVNNASMYRAGSKFSYAYELVDKMKAGSIGFDMFINDFLKVYDKKSNDINKALPNVLAKYIDYEKMMLDCCMMEENYQYYEECTKKFLKNNVEFDKKDIFYMPKLSDIMNFDAYKRTFTMEAFVTNSNVNFVARSYKFDDKLYNGHMQVLNNIVDYEYLLQEIRVKGGAYGSRMVLSRYGNATFYSYSDPNFVNTDNVYKNTNIFIKSIDMSQEDLEANIIGTMKKVDTYPLPYDKHVRNMSYYIRNLDNDYINEFRNEILDTTLDDIKVYADVFAKAVNGSEFCALVTAQNESTAKDKYKIVKKLGK